jgi:hypothetical protein
MAFVQIMTYSTTKREEMDAALQRWLDDTEDVRRARKRILLKDRDATDCYVELVFFDSYEDAMHNSTLPATGALFEQAALLCDDLHFQNLDLLIDSF